MPAWVSSPVHRAIIEDLIRARKAVGMTQRDLAAKIGKPPSFVGKVESIERNISVPEFVAWTRALDLGGNDILQGAALKHPGKVDI